MRGFLLVLGTLVVLALAFWAYNENYRTKAAIDGMTQVRRDIAGLRESLGVLRAEWAYLNRPERLQELVNLNFDRLQLLPMDAAQFGSVEQVARPAPPAEPTPEATPEPTPEEASQ
ncbi:cell division protein FtsL [Paracoccus sp. p4-l81]|uniref:cell division protein FtsL n=1 Tax=unclassified Paracoccus (in: a-proteobacteria) TaxID=2688777 RepID=UPI0035B7131A